MARDERELRYAKTHEWIAMEGEKAVIGITAFAVKEMQELVFIDLPEVGQEIEAGSAFGSVESVKAVGELYAPVGGKVSRVNSALEDAPELVSNDPYGEGWLVEMEVAEGSDVSGLLSKEQYDAMVAEGEGGE